MISMSGWNSSRLLFKVIAKQRKEDVEVFKCIDTEGREFYIEDSSMFTNYCTNSSTFNQEIKTTLGTIINVLQHTKNVFEVNFLKINKEERTIRGYFVSADEDFGYSKVFDLDSKTIKNVNNRKIQYLIVNNTKYTVE
jgi:hypothetical protein